MQQLRSPPAGGYAIAYLLTRRSLFIGHWGMGIGERGEQGVAIAIRVKTLYPALTQAFQETDMPKPPGKNNTSWQPAWNNGKTRTIRVPVALAEQILEYAYAIDSGLVMDQQMILRVIDSFVESRIAQFHPNQYSRTGSTTSRRWDELRRFRDTVAIANDHTRSGLTLQSDSVIAPR
ncbi:MAG: hypothetical protein HWQ35_00595 [Nostoc sp. NMS1]|uniref:hypothetical protein n=1 Tax=unclassified Nostoc TaxID=2593658 RepID=UPI0025ED25F6|nr:MULTISPECIES: hypothetical protein [unclassified Nostoc]MBN3905123.1 hypothetical protein [Nostoc sp. NMS1]MBN3989227.1 hypothetical protein [Nostoc sp. NMS2]